MVIVCSKFDRNRTISGCVVDNLANFGPITSHCDLESLTFVPLSLNMCGSWGTMRSTYVPNLSEIDQSVAELLMINDRLRHSVT